MPGFIDLSAHLSAPQGLTRLTNVRFFDSWAFLGLTSLKCTLILAGRPGGGVWWGGTSPGRPGGSLSTHVHVSSQGHLGLMYRSCFDSGFGWFNLHRFLFTLSAKTIKTPRIWNFEVNFFRRRLAHNERGHVSSQGQCFSSEFGWFNLPRFFFTLSAKTIKTPRAWNFEVNFFRRRLVHNERGHVSSQSHLCLMFLTRRPTLTCQHKESKKQKESKSQTCQPSYFFRKNKKADKCRVL